jgi:hypothetical protein
MSTTIPLHPLKPRTDEKLEDIMALYGNRIVPLEYPIRLPTEQEILDQLVFTVKDERLSFLLPGHNKYDILGKLISNRSLFAEIHKKYQIAEIISIDFGKPQRLVLINGLKKEAFIPVISKEVITDYAELEAKIKSHLPKELHIEQSQVRKPVLTAKELAERYISFDKVTYTPSSESPAIGSVIPSNMATETDKVLAGIEAKHGSVDRFVMLRLDYKNKEELYEAFAGEQVDAIAMAIAQVESGYGMIIGDMTGLGKGRECAGMIRYSIKQGKIPIFFTEKANLFSDLYRDLKDIGCDYYRPFIVNDKNGDNDPTIVDEYGMVVHKIPPAAVKSNAYKKGIVPHGFDFIMATYSQFTSSKPSEKKTWLAKISMDQPVYMDESHNVSGDSNSGEYFQAILRSVQSVCYFSATFAKRPDNMPVYASKTAMQEANMSQVALIEAIVKGGVAMQEIISANLVESGQMVRRERDMTGVKNYFSVLKEKKESHWEIADAITEIVRDILWFQKDFIDDIIADLAADAREEDKKITYTSYSAKVFNIIDQMLFAIKAESVADAAIKACKNNRKPVIAFKSTMEAFMKNSELVVGDFLATTNFELSLIKGLEGILNYSIKDIDDEEGFSKVKCRLEFDELPAAAQMAYGEIMYKIANTSTPISISPIDIITKRITDAGYKVGEITGRKMCLEFNDDGSANVKHREERDLKKIVRSFNHGEGIDVVLLNASGATGLSMHASAKFKDQRQRMLITHQLEGDINKEIQKRGRIDRSGQVERGEYWYIVTSIPAESRLLMMFKEKLKSLDANTTSSQKTNDGAKKLVDFLNKYGDQIIVEYLKENRELNTELLDPIKIEDMNLDELQKLKTVEGAAHKVTGRIAILPCEAQERFYEAITQRYSDFIQYLNDTDTNDLEVAVLNLEAEIIAHRPYMYGSGGKSPFGKDSTIEKVRCNLLKKPLTKDELETHINEALDGLLPAQKQKVLVNSLDTYYKGRAKEVEEYLKDKFTTKKQEASEKYTLPDMLKGAFKLLVAQENTELTERLGRLESEKQYVRKVFINFQIGDEYDVPSVITNEGAKTNRGIFLGYKSNHHTVNPYAPSNIIMCFATLDGRRMVQVPLSITDWINAALKAREARKLPDIPLRHEWGMVRTDSAKEVRYIITGNILQAYQNVGQLVAYTTVDGDLKKGILMPTDFRPDDFIMVPAMQALKEAREMLYDDTLVSSGKEITLTRRRNGYGIDIPAPKTIGGMYYSDKTLCGMLDIKFIQFKGKMTGHFGDEHLNDMFLLFAEKFKLKFKVKIKPIAKDEHNGN